MNITLVETPRDAFQGLPQFVPTAEKLAHAAALLEAGFKHLDLGSFVSSKAVPQMADSAEVFAALKDRPAVERIAIVANAAGAARACAAAGVDTLGFPFGLSERFQFANSRLTRRETWAELNACETSARQAGKGFILYLSMAFGNLEGEPWSLCALDQFVTQLAGTGIKAVSLADTVAVAQPTQVGTVVRALRAGYPKLEFSAHFHSRPGDDLACIDAALDAGIVRFDCAAGGLGGCPFAHDMLIANTPSEVLARHLARRGFETGLNLDRLDACAAHARELQRRYA
jgi:hydroxymethylglutaryl-CoA lyase